MSRKSPALSECLNLGTKIAAQLRGSGITSIRQLARIGPASAYRRLCRHAGKRLPLCYYLYSLEGALRGIHWSLLSANDKRRLRLAVEEGEQSRSRRRHRLSRVR
jgi:DNA transformation protein and related proteins